MSLNRDKPTKTFSGMSIQLSPQRVPPAAEKNPKKQRKKADAAALPIQDAKNVLFEELMSDPLKKKMVMQLLKDNKSKIQEYQRNEHGASSPINKIKNKVVYESPTALMKRRQLMEKQKQQQIKAASSAAEFESKLQTMAVTPSRKPVKKHLLKDVVAYVEVLDMNHVDKSAGVKALLLKMGATIATRLTSGCTHVIYKDGSYETFKKTKQMKLPLVSILWLDAMDRTGFRVPSQMYPALGDHESKKTCDALCEKLENKRKSTTVNSDKTRRKTLVPSQTFELDDIYLMDMQEDKDDDPDIIASSQPETCSFMLNKTRQTLENKSMAVNNDEIIESDSDSVTSDAPSDTPLISGRPTRKTRAELEASSKLSETLLNSPYINKKRGAGQSNSFNDYAEKENRVTNTAEAKKSLFKQITKRKAMLRHGTETTESETNTENESSCPASPEVCSTPNTPPRRTRRTLLPPELMGVIVDETNNDTVPMEITKHVNSTQNGGGGRKTNNVAEHMEITDNIQDLLIDNASAKKDKTIDRTSLASANTSKSDDLTSYGARRITRRMSTFMSKPETPKNTKNTLDGKETIGSCSKLSLRISEEVKDTSLKKNSVEKIPRTSNASSARTSTSDDLTTYATRRITRRMSTHIKQNSDKSGEMSPLQLSDRLSKSQVNLSLRISEKSTSIPSLRLSDENSNKNESDAAKTSDRNIQESPVTNLSNKLQQTSISTNNLPKAIATSVNKETSMFTNSIETASTSYSIVDDSSQSRGEQSSRSKSARPSLISDLTTSNATSATTTSKTSSSSSKRKLCNPDECSEDSRDGRIVEEEERQMRLLDSQSKMQSDATRKVLEKRLDILNIPDDNMARTKCKEINDDGDFEETPLMTQRTQFISTQSQSGKKNFIVSTRFHNDQIKEFRRIVGKLGEFTIEHNVTSKTTHLVAMESSRTLNFLRAMSRGIWILNSDWLFKSEEAGKWLEEDCYEMTEFSPLVQQLRLQRESFGQAKFCHDVFINCGAIYISATCHPSKRELEELVLLCKGELTSEIEKAKIVIGGIPCENTHSQVHLKEAWILDCITFGRCKKFTNYLIAPAIAFIKDL